MTLPGISLRAIGAWFLLLLGFSVQAQPTIIAFDPFQGPPGTVMTIVGTGLIGPGFIPGTGQRVIVYFTGPTGGGLPAQIIDGDSTRLRVIVPEGAKSGPFTVYTSAGQRSSMPYAFYLPPKVTDFGTVVGPDGQFVKPVVGRPGQTLRIRGENFIPPAGNVVVKVAGHLFVRTIVADSQIDVQLDNPPQNGPVETGPISVATVTGTNVTSEYLYAQPIISKFTPAAPAGAVVRLDGFNFLARSTNEVTVKFGSVVSPKVTLDSNTNITAEVPRSALTGPISFAAPGGAYVTITNFVVLPSIDAFTPSSGPAGTVVKIDGSGLNGTTQVRFGNTIASKVTNISQLQITAVVPANVTTGPITVTTTNGVAVSSANFFGPPQIDNLTPLSGDVSTIVTVSGANLLGTTQVALNGVAVPDFLVLSNQQLTFAVPPGASSGKVKVVTPGGEDTSELAFTVRGPEPVISQFTPSSGGPGTQVVLKGLNLTTVTNVTFNGAKAVFTLVQQTNLQATVPADATTGPIRVTSPSGSAQTAASFVVGTSADVRLTFAGSPDPAVAYGTLTYGLQAFNNGPLPAQNTVIEFTIPASTSLIEASGSVPPQVNGNKVTYTRGTMDPGSVFTGTIKVNAGPPATVVAFGQIQTSTPDPNSGNNQKYSTNAVALPTLAIESIDTLGILLSWPSAAGPIYRLESASPLNGGFSPVAGTAVDDGSQLQLIVPATNSQRWFRLDLIGP